VLSVIILAFSYLLVVQNPETEKMSAYECGFEPYEDARHKFDVKFYLVAMLFIVFDIETMYLIPWSVTISKLNLLGFWAMMDFIIELGIGFIYVWYIGGLDWD
jgi:NADH:ubiquinone oxidoreductase subunit 3 (subunit A)